MLCLPLLDPFSKYVFNNAKEMDIGSLHCKSISLYIKILQKPIVFCNYFLTSLSSKLYETSCMIILGHSAIWRIILVRS